MRTRLVFQQASDVGRKMNDNVNLRAEDWEVDFARSYPGNSRRTKIPRAVVRVAPPRLRISVAPCLLPRKPKDSAISLPPVH